MAKIKKEKYLKHILKFYKKHIILYVCFLVILLIKAVASFFSAMLVAKMITFVMESNYTLALNYALYNLLILLGSSIFSWLNTYFYKNLENRVKFDIQQQVVSSALNTQMSFYDSVGTGVIITRLTSDIDHLSDRFKTLTEKIVNVVRRIAYLAYIFVLDFRLGFVVLGSVIIVAICYAIRIYWLKKLKPGVKRQQEKVNSRIIETVRAVKDIKTLNCDNNTLEMIAIEQKQSIKLDNHEYYVGNGLCKITDIFTHIADYIFMIFSVLLLLKYNLTATVFYTCYLYKDHTFTLANEIGDFRYKLAECEVYAKRVHYLLCPNEKDVDKYGDKYPENYQGDIEFKNVNFEYKQNLKVLDDISFKIEPKQTIALVGESGSGKSTITNLIAHLYYKNSGQILFGGTEIEDLNRKFIKENIAMINQFPYIFNMSIRENFKMINKAITDTEILKLCKDVGLYDFINSLPLGLDSVIGEGGCQLSGGQRQKLCIARALSRNVKVMIFDEATSSLDNTSQDEVMDIIRELSKKITIIIIAHRLSTITYADKIMLIKQGKIVAQGKHEKLLETNKYYQSLYLKSKNIHKKQ